MDQRVTLLGCDTEGVGEIGTRESLTNRELEHESIALVEAGGRRTNECRQFVVRDGLAGFLGVVSAGHVRSTFVLEVDGCGTLAFLGSSVDLVSKHRIEPRFQTIRFAKLTETFGCDAEDVLHHVGCIVSIGEHRRRSVVQTRRIAVVDRGKSTLVPGEEVGDESSVGREIGHGSKPPRSTRASNPRGLTESLPDLCDRRHSSVSVEPGREVTEPIESRTSRVSTSRPARPRDRRRCGSAVPIVVPRRSHASDGRKRPSGDTSSRASVRSRRS